MTQRSRLVSLAALLALSAGIVLVLYARALDYGLVWMDETEIAWYVATGEPLDKAGAYGVQGLGARFIEEVHGSFTNVMGLPARAVYRLLRASPDPALALLALASG